MSRRRRTTARMFESNGQAGNAKRRPSQSRASVPDVTSEPGEQESQTSVLDATSEPGERQGQASLLDVTSEPGEQVAPEAQVGRITAEVLARRLDEESLLREAAEERAASAITRTFRLTLGLVAVNTLVAGATMVALWSRPGKLRETTSLTSPPASRICDPPRADIAPPVPTIPAAAPPAPAVAPPAAESPVIVPREATPPKGKSPSNKREALAALPKPRRAAVKPQAIPPEPAPPETDEGEKVALDNVVERW